jgi:prepilin-type N-terminal cleavage/methylation domain-containing protein
LRADRRFEAGFTLVELLVALVLFAMLSGVVFTALRFGAATLRREAAAQESIEALTSSELVLHRMIEAAYPAYLPAPLPGLTGRVDFDGTDTSMAFLTQAPLGVAPGGFARVRLWAAGHNLLLAARPELAWPGTDQTSSETLASGIAGAKFAYFGPDAPGQPGYWHADWEDRTALPSLIRISVVFPPGGPTNWPDLLIAPMVVVDESCRFVALTQSCQGR